MEEYNLLNNTAPNQPTQPVPPKARSGGTGSIVGAIIIIILLALGALYFWGARLNQKDTNPPPLILGNETTESTVSDSTAGLPPQQTSDSAEAINADIQAMNLDALSTQTASSLQAYQAATQ